MTREEITKLESDILKAGEMKGYSVALLAINELKSKDFDNDINVNKFAATLEVFLYGNIREYVKDDTYPEEDRQAVVDTLYEVGLLGEKESETNENEN